jgi:hypothetical protein
MHKKIKLLLIFLLLTTSLITNAKTIEFQDLTILVSSCDKYSVFWDPFFSSLFKNWPSLLQEHNNLPILLITNSKSFDNQRVINVHIPNESSWSDNMLYALEQVQTKYVLVTLDDYWINQPVNEQRLLQLYDEMQTEHAAMLQLSNNDPRYQRGKPHATIANLLYTEKFSHYKASLQLAIWDKDALKVLLKPGEDPWSFEIAGTARSHGYPRPFLSLAGDEPIAYINASHQGHINPVAIAYAVQFQMPFAYGDFPVLGKFNYRITYGTWKKRVKKLISFLQHPGLFYEADFIN